MDLNMEDVITRAVVSGFIAVLFALIAALIADLLIASDDLTWSLIAVAFAAFFGGLAGYVTGARNAVGLGPGSLR
jgi:hypothetical protein